ncbi:acyltransferase family protein [Pyxidicoccus sp. MSG2]|uniref:acyltransferase family protein n=1 Tax=Pyxidicoccus sp. MSG2 TaxID=2996790 RepID=UPI00226EA715|nr:acyltransferase [Pyxidicoccus sp. MSG2]MCY1020598.1 acyltransferase [Pyxidicoccus sp. MSG2]
MAMPAATLDKTPPIQALSGLRFVMSLIVLACHYLPLIAVPPLLKTLLAQGSAAVNCFFMLSGFLLAYNYRDTLASGQLRWRDFMRMRLGRVFPVHLATLALVTPITLYLLDAYPALMARDLAMEVTQAQVAGSWLSNLLLVQVFIPHRLSHIWNGPSWSIGAELFFYLLLPFFARYVLARLNDVRSMARAAAVLFAIQVVAVIATALVIFLLSPPGKGMESRIYHVVYMSPLLRVWEFFLGCVLGTFFLHHQRQGVSPRLTAVLTQAKAHTWALVLVALVALLLALPSPRGFLAGVLQIFRWYVLYTPVCGLLILLLASRRSFVSRLLEHRWMVFMGEASYSLYMIHWLPCVLLVMYKRSGGELAAWWPYASMAGTLVAAVGLFQLVERPARKLLRPGAPAPVPGALLVGRAAE